MVIVQLTTVITTIKYFFLYDRHTTIRIIPEQKKLHSTDDIFPHVLAGEEAALKLKYDDYLKDRGLFTNRRLLPKNLALSSAYTVDTVIRRTVSRDVITST